MCRFSLWNSFPKWTKSRTSLLPFRTVLGSQAAFSWHHSVRGILSKWLPTSLSLWVMAALEPYYLSQTCFKLWNDSIEDSEVDNRLEKIDFADLVKDALWSQLQGFILTANFETDGMTSHEHGLAANTVSKWRRLKSLLLKRISSG